MFGNKNYLSHLLFSISVHRPVVYHIIYHTGAVLDKRLPQLTGRIVGVPSVV